MKKSFTLIELLVVVAIISVLVAVLLPALSQARDQAKANQCRSNLRQIGTFWMLYWNENHDYIPPMQTWWNWGGTYGPNPSDMWNLGVDWLPPERRPMYFRTNQDFAWINNPQLLICPNDNRDQIAWNLPEPAWWHVGTSYANNPYLVGISGATEPYNSRFVTAIEQPSRLILLGDTPMLIRTSPVGIAGGSWHDSRGFSRNNILFFDGHAAIVPIIGYGIPGDLYIWREKF